MCRRTSVHGECNRGTAGKCHFDTIKKVYIKRKRIRSAVKRRKLYDIK